ncbi:MAG: C1 family peptidase, partial [bacterium]
MASMDVGRDLGGTQEFDSTSMSLPAEVDHRRRYGSVKNQGSAPSCIAFAATAGLEGAVRVAANERVSLSEMHLLARYRTTRYGDMI